MPQPFAEAFEALPSSVRTSGRRGALDAFLKHGLPGTDDEDWKYTDLSSLNRLTPDEIAPQTENHAYSADYDCGLDALNALLAGGKQTRELQGRVELDTARHSRLRLRVRNEAELVLQDTSPTRFSMFFAVIEVDANARLRLVRSQNAAADAHRITRLKILLARDARLEALTLDLGGALVRHDLDIVLDGPGAEAEIHGLFAPAGPSHIDNHTRIDHRAAHGQSREFFRGLAFDHAHAVFNGKIVVHPHAQKTQSEQHIASLLLSPKAEINAKPELQIEADDVKCAHGATFGQLDANALFYLRSRGLSLRTARALLTRAFVEPILARLPSDLRAFAEQTLDRRFAALHGA